MATSLSVFRRAVADELTAAGVTAFSHVPERLTPPAAVVLPDQPYVSADAGDAATMCGTFRVRLRVALLGARGTNEVAADELDELIVQAVNGLEASSSSYDVTAVSEPAEVELNGATYLGAVISLEALREMEILP